MSEKLKFAFYWGASCGGCEMAVLDINEKILDVAAAADILLWPIAVDGKYKDVEALPDKAIDVCFFNGGIRNSEALHILKLLRSKSKFLISFGACACMGGVPGMANQFNREEILKRVYETSQSTDNAGKVRPGISTITPEGELTLPELFDRVYPVDSFVEPDYYLGGCPPTSEWVMKAVEAILRRELPKKGSFIGIRKTLCDECARERSDERSVKKFYRPHEIIPEPRKCLLEQGIICCGPATRGGCKAACIEVNMPCRGCYGPPEGVVDQGAKMLSAVAACVDSTDEKEMEEILNGIKDPLGIFYQFSLPKSIIPGSLNEKNNH